MSELEPAYKSENVELYLGDALSVLRSLPDESVQMCVTSPPYWGLRSYLTEPQIWGGGPGCEHDWQTAPIPSTKNCKQGSTETIKYFALVGNGKAEPGRLCVRCGAWCGELGSEPTPELFVGHIVEIFREVKRVLRQNGVLWINLGDSYATTPTGGYGTKSNLHGAQTSDKYKETIKQVYTKKANTISFGLKPKDLVGIPWMTAFALRYDGWYLRSAITWCKNNMMPESVTDRPTKATEMLFLLSKSERYFYDAFAIAEPCVYPYDNRGARTDNRRGTECDSISGKTGLTRNRRDWWIINTQPFPGSHFAVFPEAIARIPILAGSSEKGCCSKCGTPWKRVVEHEKMEIRRSGRASLAEFTECFSSSGTMLKPATSTTIGWESTCSCNAEVAPCTVLDPFIGSGTTALVSYKLGRRCIGIELNPDYLKMASERISKAEEQLRMFV